MGDRDRDPRALGEYRYESASESLLYPTLKRLWFTPILERTPRGIPANAITLAAFALAACSVAALLWYRAWPERMLLVLAGLALWAYGTLDNIDGAQARRNGTSGPIGELLDHGTDAIVMFAIPLAFGIQWLPPGLMLASVGIGSIAFWSSMWAHHRAGKLPTTKIADVELVLSISAFFVAMGIFGPDAVLTRIGGDGPTAIELLIAAGVLGSAGQIAHSARHVPAGGRVRALALASTPHLLLLAWYWASHGAIGAGPCALLMGLLGARAALGAILARLYHARTRALDPAAVGVAAVGLLSAILGAPRQLEIASALGALAALALAVRFIGETRAIARALGVRVFARSR